MSTLGAALPLLSEAGVDLARGAQHVALGLLVWARLLPIVLLSPWLYLRAAPAPLWLAVSVVLSVCLWPAARAATPELPIALAALSPLFVRELAIGAVYGLCLALPLLAVQWAGELIDELRGGGAGADEGANEGASGSPLGQLYGFLAVAVFLAAGGHRVALEGLAESFTRVPLGELSGFAGPLELALGSARLVGGALGTALTLLLPIALALLAAELCLALLVRAGHALTALAILPSTRSLLALCVVLVGLPALLQHMPDAFDRGLQAAAELLRTL